MANIKVSEMTEATEFDDLDYTMIVQANQNKKITKENMFKDIDENIDNIETSINNLQTNIEASIDNITTYSQEEQKIGTWIDEKDWYRKVLVIDSPLQQTDYNTNITVDTMIKMDCVIKSSINGQWRNFPWLYSAGTNPINGAWAGGFYTNDDGSIVRFQAGQELMKITKAIIIFEYTKPE